MERGEGGSACRMEMCIWVGMWNGGWAGCRMVGAKMVKASWGDRGRSG